MRLLFYRDQTHRDVISFIPLRIGGGPMFSLRAAVEFTEEEALLLNKYNLDKAESGRNSFGSPPAIFTWFKLIPVCMIITLVMTAVYYNVLSERIVVRDLMRVGRRFYCDSVVELVNKEAYLNHICQYLSQVLETSKNWGDKDVVEITPLDTRVARAAILKQL